MHIADAFQNPIHSDITARESIVTANERMQGTSIPFISYDTSICTLIFH